jgi:hypothetical protein
VVIMASTGWPSCARLWRGRPVAHKVIYRGPFIKGDTGKSLLAGEVVRGLVR